MNHVNANGVTIYTEWDFAIHCMALGYYSNGLQFIYKHSGEDCICHA